MDKRWSRFLALFSPGVCILLGFLFLAYLAAALAVALGGYDPSPWIVLRGPAFWHGQLWLIATYVLQPAGAVELLLNGVVIVGLGSSLERVWSPGKLLVYCLVVTVSVGMIKVLVGPASTQPLQGSGALAFGLVVAWSWISSQESSPMSVLWANGSGLIVLLPMALSFVTTLGSGGLSAAAAVLGGGLVGWLYLSVRRHFQCPHLARPAGSERLSHLEL